VRLNLKTKTQKLKQGVLKMTRLFAATLGLLLCIKMMMNPTDTLTFGLCGLFIPIFFVYGWMAIEKMGEENKEDE
jgi:hypothetical protein